jgi:hypothetical protein
VLGLRFIAFGHSLCYIMDDCKGESDMGRNGLSYLSSKEVSWKGARIVYERFSW